MRIEIKKHSIIIDGIEERQSHIFHYRTGWCSSHPVWLDLKTNVNLRNKTVEFINHSGRNYELVDINNWHCSLKTNMQITSINGVMEYMGQKEIASISKDTNMNKLQLATDFIDEIVSEMPWYKRFIIKIQFFFDDIYMFFLLKKIQRPL